MSAVISLTLLTPGGLRAEVNPFEFAAVVFDASSPWLSAVETRPVIRDIVVTPDKLESKKKPAVVRRRAMFFSATWCGPCQTMKRYEFPKLTEHGWKFGETAESLIQLIDADSQPDLMRRHRVTALPTMVILEGDREVSRLTGQHTAKQFTDEFYSDSKRTEYTGKSRTEWTFPGSTRDDLIEHLQEGQHAGKFTERQLESMTIDELKRLHADDHEGVVVKSQLPFCPPGRQ